MTTSHQLLTLYVYACVSSLRWWGEPAPAECGNHQCWMACRLHAGPVLPGPVLLRILLNLQSCGHWLQWAETASRGQQCTKTKGRVTFYSLFLLNLFFPHKMTSLYTIIWRLTAAFSLFMWASNYLTSKQNSVKLRLKTLLFVSVIPRYQPSRGKSSSGKRRRSVRRRGIGRSFSRAKGVRTRTRTCQRLLL